VLIPDENAKDLVEIADSIKIGLEIVPARMDEVLARAMTRKPEPIEWEETTTTAAAVPRSPWSRRSHDAHPALNDRDTDAEAAVTFQNVIHSSKLGGSGRSLSGNRHGSCRGLRF
jgi:hypothetical protein